jgi:hypothetical protein
MATSALIFSLCGHVWWPWIFLATAASVASGSSSFNDWPERGMSSRPDDYGRNIRVLKWRKRAGYRGHKWKWCPLLMWRRRAARLVSPGWMFSGRPNLLIDSGWKIIPKHLTSQLPGPLNLLHTLAHVLLVQLVLYFTAICLSPTFEDRSVAQLALSAIFLSKLTKHSPGTSYVPSHASMNSAATGGEVKRPAASSPQDGSSQNHQVRYFCLSNTVTLLLCQTLFHKTD